MVVTVSWETFRGEPKVSKLANQHLLSRGNWLIVRNRLGLNRIKFIFEFAYGP